MFIDEQLLANLERRGAIHTDSFQKADAEQAEVHKLKLHVAMLENKVDQLTRRVSTLEGRIAKTHPNKAGEKVTASISSHKNRQTSLEQVVASITGQVHLLNIRLEGYSEVPAFLDKPWVNAVLHSPSLLPLGPSGKWTFPVSEGYHFLLSDNVIYPGDYVSVMTKAIEATKRRAAVGVTAHILTSPFDSYAQSRSTLGAKEALEKETPVHILGTDTLAYHSSLFDPPLEHNTMFQKSGYFQIDHVIFSLLAQQKNIPLYAVARSAEWLSDATQPLSNSVQDSNFSQEENAQASALIRSTISVWRRRLVSS